jgi:hypothetical protein
MEVETENAQQLTVDELLRIYEDRDSSHASDECVAAHTTRYGWYIAE